MDFGKAFSFVFDDEEWIKKIGVAGLISLIPLVGQLFVAGWSFEIIRRVIDDDPEPLPDWREFGEHLVKGFMVAVVGFVYALPIILITGCSLSASALIGGGDQETMGTVFGTLATCLSCLSVLYSIFLGFILPAAIGHYAAEGEFGAAFRFGKVFRLVGQNLGAYALWYSWGTLLPAW